MRMRALDKTATMLSDSLDENCEALVDDQQLTAVFGEKYVKCPDKFEFSLGDKKLLTILANHVKNLVDGNGENKISLSSTKKRKRATRKYCAIEISTLN